jgi:hypothetical protein
MVFIHMVFFHMVFVHMVFVNIVFVNMLFSLLLREAILFRRTQTMLVVMPPFLCMEISPPQYTCPQFTLVEFY